MKRAPIVLAGTAAGLVGLVGYHTSATGSIGLAGGLTGPPASAAVHSAGTTSTHQSPASHAATKTTKSNSATGTTASTGSPSTSSQQPVGPALSRSAVGHDVQYGYGDLAVKVTMLGSKITNVSMARAGVADQQSASIDQYVLPILRREALSAQGAKIQGISGASYTSQAYAQSLQSAIDKLTTAHT